MAKSGTKFDPVDISSDVSPSTDIWWPRVVLTWVWLTWAHFLLSSVFNRPSWVFKSMFSVCNRPSSFFRCNPQPPMPPNASYTPCQPLSSPHPQYRHLVVKLGTTSGQHDIWSAFRSGWSVVRCTSYPITLPTPPQYPTTSPGRGIYWPQIVLLQVSLKFGQTLGQADLWSDVPPSPW